MKNHFDRTGEKAVGFMVKMVKKTTLTDVQHKERKCGVLPSNCAGVFYQAKRPTMLHSVEKQQDK